MNDKEVNQVVRATSGVLRFTGKVPHRISESKERVRHKSVTYANDDDIVDAEQISLNLPMEQGEKRGTFDQLPTSVGLRKSSTKSNFLYQEDSGRMDTYDDNLMPLKLNQQNTILTNGDFRISGMNPIRDSELLRPSPLLIKEDMTFQFTRDQNTSMTSAFPLKPINNTKFLRSKKEIDKDNEMEAKVQSRLRKFFRRNER